MVQAMVNCLMLCSCSSAAHSLPDSLSHGTVIIAPHDLDNWARLSVSVQELSSNS